MHTQLPLKAKHVHAWQTEWHLETQWYWEQVYNCDNKKLFTTFGAFRNNVSDVKKNLSNYSVENSKFKEGN